MGLVDDDQVPPGLFQVVAVLAVTLEGIDRDDGPVVVVERVVIGWNVAADALNASRVQPGERDGKAVPELLLELAHHALGGDHQNAPSLAAAHQLGSEDAGFEGFTQTNGIRNQQAWAQLLQYSLCRLELERQRIHHRVLANHRGTVLQCRLAQPRLNKQARGGEGGRLVVDQLGLGRVDQGDAFQLG
ncbi:hypothetical protein D9M70_437220 [compost metagenome]